MSVFSLSSLPNVVRELSSNSRECLPIGIVDGLLSYKSSVSEELEMNMCAKRYLFRNINDKCPRGWLSDGNMLLFLILLRLPHGRDCLFIDPMVTCNVLNNLHRPLRRNVSLTWDWLLYPKGVVFPTHVNNNHWVLVHLLYSNYTLGENDSIHGSITIYDSNTDIYSKKEKKSKKEGSENSKERRQHPAYAKQIFSDIHKLIDINCERNSHSAEKSMDKWTHQQKDGVNCGVHTIVNGIHLALHGTLSPCPIMNVDDARIILCAMTLLEKLVK